MDTALLVARLILAIVFVVAGIAKLADVAGSRRAIADFGVPTALANPIGALLPLVEIGIAVALIPKVSAWGSAIAALVLLLLFVAGIAYNMAKGRAPDCHCFGQLHSEPVGWPTLVRNGILAAIAAFVVWEGHASAGTSAVAWFARSTAYEKVGVIAGVIAFLLIAAEGWVLIHLLSQNGRLLLRIDAMESGLAAGGNVVPAAPAAAPAPPVLGLPVGSKAPGFVLSGLHGETQTLDALRAAGKPVMLVFSDPGCGPCNALLPEIGRWQHDHGANVTIALISRGTQDANRAKSAEHGITNVLLQQDREVAQEYQANGTPSAVIVQTDGTIGSTLGAGADAVRALVAQVTGGRPAVPAPVPAPAPAPAPAAANGNGAPAAAPTRVGARGIGEPAPDVRLPDINGQQVSLADFRGDNALVLFWNPGCGFCRRMLDDLKAWEANPPAGAPKLVIVTTGTAESNREMGLRSPMVLDEGFATGRAFGASGTPSAVLVDAAGRVASGVAVGAPGVLALANNQPVAAPEAPAPNGGGAMPKTPKVGDPAPPIRLPDLTGKRIDLTASRGTRTLVLFWNPGCGFCRRMLDDLKAWEAKPPKGAPKLLVVSTGTAEANKELGLRSPVVLDEGFSVGSAFGASGTPSAVLVDARGNIASELAVGAPAVLALAGAAQDQAQPTMV